MHIRLAELAERLGVELQGDGNLMITGVSTLKDAGSGEIAFLDRKSVV